MKKYYIIIVFCIFMIFPVSGDNIIMPGIITVFEDSEIPPTIGFSFKSMGIPDKGFISFSSFELRAAYNFEDEISSFDFSWPSFYGFLVPGFSLEYSSNGFTPWFYGELDLFYFPFAFATIMIFDEPLLIPSFYLVYKFGPAGDRLDAGFRLSFPIYNKGD
jgi:hypothetical protein